MKSRKRPGAHPHARLWLLVTALFVPWGAFPAQQDPPATLPAEALSLGAQFEEAAPESVKKWCRKTAQRKELRNDPQLKTAAALVDLAFPRAGSEARGAATYLLLYSAYREESRLEAALASRISDAGFAMSASEHALPSVPGRANQPLPANTRAAPLLGSPSNEEDRQRLENEEASASRERHRRLGELARVRARLDAVLRILGATHARARLVPAARLAELAR